MLWNAKTNFNGAVICRESQNESKKADVTPVSKKDDPTKAKNYRPVSEIPVLWNVFERIKHKHISKYDNHFWWPYLCGFRQDFTT